MDPRSFSYANFENLQLLEDLHANFQKDPESVDPSWRHFFEGMEIGRRLNSQKSVPASPDLRIYRLIDAYRTYGHLMARFNPLENQEPPEPKELNTQMLGFNAKELDVSFPTCGFMKEEKAPLKTIVEELKKTYCRTIGIEYMELREPGIEKWLQERIEPGFKINFSHEDKIHILSSLSKAELFETFIHTKYVGQKRFSLEGGETLIPMLSALIEQGSKNSITDVVLGMAHRGRLNVLANILNKSYAHIFHEFEDFYTPDSFEGTGDVKYHKGFIGSLKTVSGEVKVVLSANPSHLESVDPVVEGNARALQELKKDKGLQKEILPILIHGDAALAGQGVIYETMQMCHLNGYSTGGTLHIVINNQIGFTTLPKDSRSTRYCTDIARSFGAPVFHVSAEDPEGCVTATHLALEMRQQFGCDVFIDLLCYRKYGHNESDEPTFTQPREYQIIKQKLPIRKIYEEKLVQEGVLSGEAAAKIEFEFKESLDLALKTVKERGVSAKNENVQEKPDLFKPVKTAATKLEIIQLAQAFSVVPQDFNLHPKITRLLKERLEMVEGDEKTPRIDWGMGEHLAFASLLAEGIHVRLSGQDSRRGTFTHRHAVWVDQKTHERYFPLSHLKKGQGLFDVFNSHLSEFSVLGFEFGYTLSYPKALVIWEAQFGDFVNGAQIIIDQYLASSEQKWGLASNLTLMLPHGYEGQGPEHSSGKMERFLQLCADDNIQVVNCTTPSQLFHLLRRQSLREVQKPLIIFTPKALLRHKEAVSSLESFTKGTFEEVLDDPLNVQSPQKLVLCSGKVYYDLIAERAQRNVAIVIVRLEQLYPLDEKKLVDIVRKHSDVKEIVWVQEEHSNMGAWEYIRPHLIRLFGKVNYAGRARAASPAAGSYVLHKKQYAAIMEDVFKEIL
ncbi:MAG: 2-oxoglutarate dehydrogenase E1 component [Chlamydiota bacterium]